MENDHPPPVPRKLPAIVVVIWGLVWALMCIVMIMLAILGFVCFVVGAISLLVVEWPIEMHLGGKQVETLSQKALFAGVGVGLCAVAAGFWWLQKHGYVVSAAVLYAFLTFVVYALRRLTESSDLLSIGW